MMIFVFSGYLKFIFFNSKNSGPSGCVLANRLTENPNWNVLLIEAGTVETIVEQVPLFAPYEFLTRYNWGYLAEKQPYSCWGKDNFSFLVLYLDIKIL